MPRLHLQVVMMPLILALTIPVTLSWILPCRFVSWKPQRQTRDVKRQPSLPLTSNIKQRDDFHPKRWVGKQIHLRKPLLMSALWLGCLWLPMKAASAAQAVVSPGYQSNPAVSFMSVSSPVSRLVELRLAMRLVGAGLLGAIVGKERAGSNHHAAGVRTMALVATGAASFTMCSMYGFSSFGRYDPSRMASNVASGVGFIGAGVITTTSATTSSNQFEQQERIVHGLTTAAAIWLSAAIGVATGVGMYYLATVATMLTLAILKYGKLASQVVSVENIRLRNRQKGNDYRREETLEIQEDDRMTLTNTTTSSSNNPPL